MLTIQVCLVLMQLYILYTLRYVYNEWSLTTAVCLHSVSQCSDIDKRVAVDTFTIQCRAAVDCIRPLPTCNVGGPKTIC